MHNARLIRTFIGAMIVAVVATAGYAGLASHEFHGYLTLAILALATATSRMKVKLPGINGNMSVNLPLLLTAVVNLSAAEAAVVTCVSIAAQCWPKKNAKFNAPQMTFNLSMTVFASSLASLVFHAGWWHHTGFGSITLGLVIATATLFLGQTLPLAGIVAIAERKTAGPVWWNLANLSFPYYVVSVGVTSMVQAIGSHLGWGLALAVLPVMYSVHRSYRTYFGRIAEPLTPQVMVRAAAARA